MVWEVVKLFAGVEIVQWNNRVQWLVFCNWEWVKGSVPAGLMVSQEGVPALKGGKAGMWDSKVR